MSSEILSIKVEHVEDVLETYNVLQVARSTTGIGGPFTVLSPNVTLYAWQRTYYFTDTTAEPSYFYQTRFYNTLTGLTSKLSRPFAAPVIDPSLISVAQASLIDGSGYAIKGQKVLFYYNGPPLSAGGYNLAPANRPIEAESGIDGTLNVPLVQGSQWKVVFVGTPYIREITVPTGVAKFDLLSLMGAAPDAFSVAELEFPAAPRRSI